ncbi:hypothetical protein Q3V37_23095 [Micromonospora profundi]|uniref:Uncharacterized protein n=1 Tax=Micromonospora profundi TaxID=1420889 RepID=A0AAJ6HQB5_9ACTN|nr:MULTISPECIES: hypothetical protein [Micromonospora]KOX04803.1 hypothetical protein ADK66_26120 [Micromonospora sp. NRRL B-16802]WLS44267.1 hypothetical protein Q3V37_23095 [Micromonospora profundi]
MTDIRVPVDGADPSVERNLVDQLEGPYPGTVRRVVVPIAAAGTAAVDWTSRHPLLTVVLRRDLVEETVRVAVTVAPGAEDERALPPVVFAPWSAAGASIPVYAPDTADEPLVAAFPVTVTAERIVDGGSATAVTGAALTALVELAVLEGNLGRLLYLVSYEKHRLRRAAREVHAYRTLAHARRDALDRIGADVGVARFVDELVHEPASGEVYARRLAPPAREPDAAYAHRLGLYRRFLLPTPGAVRRLLNGPGADTDPNTGLFADLPGGARFTLREDDDRFAVAIRLVAAGDPQHRTNFLAQLRRDRLVLPANTPPNNTTHAGRALPASRLTEITALRASLRQSYAFDSSHGIAPPLAVALDRAGRVCRALGSSIVWQVSRAQDGAGGSRYELGLGVDVSWPTPAQATDLRNRVLDTGRAVTADRTAEALIAAARARGVPTVGADGELAWLWRVCGLATTHRISTTTMYLSHLPTRGLAVTAPLSAPVGADTTVEAQFHAPGDPGGNALLLAGLSAARAAWNNAGEPAWNQLTDAAARTRWAAVPTRPAGQPVDQVLAAAGLPAVREPAPVVAALNRLPDELVETIELPAALASALIAGQPDAGDRLARLVGLLREQHLAAALPLVETGNRVLLVCSVIGLPQAGLNLAERRATGFRWYTVGLGGGTAEIKAVGARTALRPTHTGLVAVVALSYVRTGLTDPYEFRVELPDGVALTLAQYERLMNALTRVCPLGVEINTFGIRRDHVDLDGNGTAEPLRPAVARTFRTFQQRRHRGVYDQL